MPSGAKEVKESSDTYNTEYEHYQTAQKVMQFQGSHKDICQLDVGEPATS